MKKTLIALMARASVSYGYTYSEANDWLQDALVDDITSYTITFTIADDWTKAYGDVIFAFGDNWNLRHEVGRYMGFGDDAINGDPYTSRNGTNASYTIDMDTLDTNGKYEGWFFDGNNGNNGNGLKGITIQIDGDSTTGTAVTLTAPGKTIKLTRDTYFAPTTDGNFGFSNNDATLRGTDFLKDAEITYTANGVKYTAAYPNAPVSVPEPATATLSLLALAGLAARRRRK